MSLARIRTVFTGVAGAPYYSNLFFFNDGGTSIASAATGWVGAFWGSLDNEMAGGLSWSTDPEVPTFDQATGKITKVDAVTPATGVAGAGAEPLPPANQLLIRLITDQFVNGRRVRGRIFVPSMLEIHNVNGAPDTTLRTLAGNAIQTLITSSASTLAIWARPFDPTPEEIEDGKTPRLGSQHSVDLGQVWTSWAILRSRRD